MAGSQKSPRSAPQPARRSPRRLQADSTSRLQEASSSCTASDSAQERRHGALGSESHAWSYTVNGRKVGQSVTGVKSDGQLRLFRRDEVWRHLAFNPHVHSGYRMALSPTQCLRSMLQLHNETGNIWSHFSVLFFFLFRTLAGGHWPGAPHFYYSAVIPCCLCLLCSTVYHTFMPLNHGEAMYQRLLFIDYLGVYNVMLWPQAYAIYWSLMCYPALRQLAFVVYFSVSAACIVLVIRASNNKQRLVPFAIQSLLRSALLCLRTQLKGGSADATLYYFLVEITGITGGILNATRSPERFSPGTFDFWFNSHQIMHILTAMSQLSCFYAGETDYYYWSHNTCPADLSSLAQGHSLQLSAPELPSTWIGNQWAILKGQRPL